MRARRKARLSCFWEGGGGFRLTFASNWIPQRLKPILICSTGSIAEAMPDTKRESLRQIVKTGFLDTAEDGECERCT